MTSDCVIEETARNFVNKKNHCYESDISADNRKLNLDAYFRNVSVVANTEVFSAFLEKHKISVRTKVCK